MLSFGWGVGGPAHGDSKDLDGAQDSGRYEDDDIDDDDKIGCRMFFNDFSSDF